MVLNAYLVDEYNLMSSLKSGNMVMIDRESLASKSTSYFGSRFHVTQNCTYNGNGMML